MRVAATIAALTVAALLLASSAAAEFTAPSLLSGTQRLQFEDAQAPTLAREGGYVAFQGSLAGVSGVWRRNLQTGAIEPVATAYQGGDPELSAPSPALSAPDAAAPSISASGSDIAFTTTANLEPEHLGEDGEPEGEPSADDGCPEVYVRDMDLPASAPGAYTLASAIEKGGAGLTFVGGCHGAGSFAIAGAQAAPGVAISASGQRVAFTVLSRSNLTRGPGCASSTPLAQCPPETPASQVAVRDIEAGTTTLVSVTPTGQPTPGGGAFPSEQSETHGFTVTSTQFGDQVTGSTAAISGDGDTVAWLGTDVPAQVPGSEEIEARTEHQHGEESAPYEVEPLWRRIAGGEDALTRRLLAGAGLEFFFSRAEQGEVVRGGSFVATVSESVFVPPALSEDGDVVALVSDAPRPSAVRGVELSGSFPPQSDAYAVQVIDDPATAPQVIPLTETPDYDTQTSAEGFVKDVAVSPDGNRVAFDCERTQLTLPALALISPPATSRTPQIYEANLALGTLQRASVTYNGSEPSGGAGLLSFSGQNGVLAFASSATNLFYGDALNASETYLTREVPYEAHAATELLTAMPNEALPQLEWKLNATATAQRDGSVLVRAQVPGAGVLTVQADAQLPARRKGPAANPGRASALVTRTVGRTSLRATVPSSLQLHLRAHAVYGADVASRHGLYTVLHISFKAGGHQTLTAEIPVTLRSTARGKKKLEKKDSKADSGRNARHGKGKRKRNGGKRGSGT